MKWFQGSIEEAILASKQRNAVFVVYIEGTDNDSSNMTKMIEDQAVSTKLESENFVAIKLDSGSQAYTQFVQIYQLVPVPSLFFIGKSGQPIEVIPQTLQQSQILEKIEQILETAGYKGSANGCGASTSMTKSDVKNETESFIQSESSSASVNTGAIKKETSFTAVQKPSIENVSKEEKIERAKQLIEQKREANRIQDEEIERNKEIERRKMGQEVQKMRRDQHEKELQQLREERQREKNEEIAARQRILAQIAQDKAERAKKFSMQPKNESQPETSSAEKIQKPVASKDYSRARLQFRLSDGSTHTNDFDSSTTLGEVIQYINANMHLPYRHFVLSTTFPRIQFESSDHSKTLLDLQLVPNAVILILPVRSSQAVTASSPNGFSALIWSLVAPFISIFEYLRGVIFRRGNSTGDARAQQEQEVVNNEATSVITGKRHVGGDASAVHRRTGNIHRLNDHNRDSDDDNNTWNGNSTQQM